MYVIGLTGGIASGKSTISNHLRTLGAYIIDADEIGHMLLEKDTEELAAIKKVFGSAIFLPNGSLDRKALGNLVFSDSKALMKLNRIVHPGIKRVVEETLDKLGQEGNVKVAVIDAALLIEAGWYDMVDEVWLVTIDEAEQVRRLMDRNKLTYEASKNRIKSQMPQDRKLKYAHRIIDNTGSREDTFRMINLIWMDLIEKMEEQSGDSEKFGNKVEDYSAADVSHHH
ncbi:MAG: dephospho-CoA kinase [Clostridia bacterium]|jgi:dephospho-CoA kinase